MKILLVCNNAYTVGNGLCTAINQLKARLVKAGHEARTITTANPDPDGPQPEYPLKHFYFPIFEPIIYANGFGYAKNDRSMMEKAVAWADVVHLEESSPLQISAISVAKRLGKPCVASYHLFAENVMANLGMGIRNPLNRIVTWFWRKLVYDHCTDIHCPSRTVTDYLTSHGFKSRLHTISNGLEISERTDIPSEPQTNPYLILCIGRLSNEKSQQTLLDAMRFSRHSKEMQLVFAGNGPKKKKYVKSAERLVADGILAHAPIFGFYTHEELSQLARKAYLYVHCAWVEVEGLSCLESIREGAVPVIAEGPVVATSQFALDSRSLFPVKNPVLLADRIDWWIEHPEERCRMSALYASSVNSYGAEESLEKMLDMYTMALKG